MKLPVKETLLQAMRVTNEPIVNIKLGSVIKRVIFI
jgi:hypothetical protein